MTQIHTEGLPLFAKAPPPWRAYEPGRIPPPRARLDDPETSQRAAERALAEQERQALAIMGALRQAGPQGATARELADALEWGQRGNVVVSRRVTELREAGELVTYDGKADGFHRLLPGHRLPKVTAEGCAVHVAARHASAPPPERKKRLA